MTKHDVASLCMKVLGIYCFIEAIPLLQPVGQIIGLVAGDAERLFSMLLILLGTLLPSCLLVAIGCGLLFGSNVLASRLVGAPAADGAGNGLAAAHVQAVAFAAVGVFVFALAVPKLFQIAANIPALRRAGAVSQAERSLLSAWPHIVGLVVQATLGVGLFFGATGLARLWRRVRGRAETGQQPTSSSSQQRGRRG